MTFSSYYFADFKYNKMLPVLCEAKKIVFEIIADSECTTPVSYTHLDVYKRQEFTLYNKVYYPIHKYILNTQWYGACVTYGVLLQTKN